jgi:serine/threonine protein kinase
VTICPLEPGAGPSLYEMLNSEIPRLSTGGHSGAQDEVLGRLGAGGMAEVWLLRRRGVGGFEKYFALKRIRAELVENSGHVAMFLDEARLAAMLHHPGIVQVFDIGEDELGFWYVMEYVRGRSAGQVLRQAKLRGKPLPVECAVYIGLQMARALHYAHHRVTSSGPLGLVHRDVSPGNVLLAFDGAVKLADFGVARASGRLVETVGGEFKGKYVYASPEQVRGERLDSRSDLFSLGLVIHELITGNRVFGDDVESPYAAIQAVLHAPIRPPSASQPACPAELDEVVLRAVQRDIDRRFATGAEMAAALDRVASQFLGRATPERLMGYLADLFGEEARVSVPQNLEPRDPVLSRSVVTSDGFRPEEPGSIGSAPTAPSSRPEAAFRSDRVSGPGPDRRTEATALVRVGESVRRAIESFRRPGDVRSSVRMVEEGSGELVEPSTSTPTSVAARRRGRYRVVAVAALSFVAAAVTVGVTLGRTARPAPLAPVLLPSPVDQVPAAAVAPPPAETAAAPAPAPLPAFEPAPAAALVAEPAADPRPRDTDDDRRASASRSSRDRSSRRKSRRSSSRASSPPASSAPAAKEPRDTKDARPKARDDKREPVDLLDGIQPWTP